MTFVKRCLLVGLLALMTLPGVAQESAPTETPIPTVPEGTPDPEATEESSLTLVIAPAEGQEIDPPIRIELPEGWRYGNGTTLVQDPLGLVLVPFTIYTGPVTGGEGYIIVVWGYDSIGYENLLEANNNTETAYLDALRMLRVAIVGTDCVPGVDVERDFSVGGIDVRGANWSAYRCTDMDDARGWFLGHSADGMNFGFYMFTEPLTAMDGQAPFELQAILDTVEFRVQDWLLEQAEQTPEATFDPAAELSPTATTTP